MYACCYSRPPAFVCNVSSVHNNVEVTHSTITRVPVNLPHQIRPLSFSIPLSIQLQDRSESHDVLLRYWTRHIMQLNRTDEYTQQRAKTLIPCLMAFAGIYSTYDIARPIYSIMLSSRPNRWWTCSFLPLGMGNGRPIIVRALQICESTLLAANGFQHGFGHWLMGWFAEFGRRLGGC